MSSDGARLYELVRQYAAIGHHRTGTANDEATRAWLDEQLRALGAEPTEVPYAFPRFDPEHHVVEVDGEAVSSAPLWYAGEGVFDTTLVVRHAAAALGPEAEPAGTSLVVQMSGDVGDRPAIVATGGSGGRLVVPNRPPTAAVDRPHALVAGRLAEQLEDAPIRYRARLVRRRGESANVLAWFGDEVVDPIVVTTPLSGWFACAGERGTGIAVALDVARELADEGPVLFAGTTGHEIGYLGVESLVASGALGRPRAVVHVGASLAAGIGQAEQMVFAPDRYAFTNLAGSVAEQLSPIVSSAAWKLQRNPASWLGEGEVLRRLDSPMLSLLGVFPLFHTEDDLPEAATSPSLLGAARDASLAACRVLSGESRSAASRGAR